MWQGHVTLTVTKHKISPLLKQSTVADNHNHRGKNCVLIPFFPILHFTRQLTVFSNILSPISTGSRISFAYPGLVRALKPTTT